MKTLSTLLLTSLFVAPVALAVEQKTTSYLDYQSDYTWQDPSNKTGGGFTWEDPSKKTGGGFTWEDPSKKSGGGYQGS